MSRDDALRYTQAYRDAPDDMEIRMDFEDHQATRVASKKQKEVEQDRVSALHTKDEYLTKMRGNNSGKFGSKDSDEIYANSAWSEVEERLLLANRGVSRAQMHRLIKDRNFNEDFVKEMVEPGSSGSPVALRFAETFREEQLVVIQRANNQGAAVIPFDDPVAALQWHDPSRIVGVTKKEWVDFTHGLQREKGALSIEELGRFYDEVVTPSQSGGDLLFDFEGLRGGPKRRGSIIRRLTQRSFAPIRFRNADDWLQYNQKFGHQSPLQAAVYSLRWQTRLSALTERLGPDPYKTHAAIKKSILGDSDGISVANDSDHMDYVFNHLLGDLPEPSMPRLQSLVNAILNLNIISKLGFAPLTAMNDLGVASVHLHYQGGTFLKSYSKMISETIKGQSKEMQTDIFRSLHSGTDGVFSFGMGRYQIGDSQPGAFTDLVDSFVNVTGLVQLTNRMRTAYSKITALHMGDMATQHSWSTLPSRYKEFLGVYGIDAKDWKLIQEKGVVTMDELIPDVLQGKKVERIPREHYVVPEGVLRGEKKPTVHLKSVSQKLSRLYFNEARTAIPEAGLRAREFMMLKQYDGTAAGLALRLFWQFRTPTVHMMQTMFPRMRTIGPAALMHALPLTGIGYAALTAKDFFRGRSPRDPTDPQTFLLSAGQTGFFFGMSDIVARINSHGSPNFDELIGGTNYTMFKDFAEVSGGMLTGDKAAFKAYNFLKSITPFGNIWYGEAAMNYFVHDRFREMWNPGFSQRQSAFLASRGQTKFFGYQPDEF